MAVASGIAKVVALKRESAWGVAPGASGAKTLRRVTSAVDLMKAIYESNEIRSDYQDADVRHGVRSVAGPFDGELSPGSYQDFFDSALRKSFVAVTAPISGLTITIAGSGPTYTVTRSAGDWLASGIKLGNPFRLTAGAFTAANLNKNMVPIAITALVMTVIVLNGSALVAEGPIASATVTVPGKKTYTPLTGHEDISFALEHWHSDINQSELFLGVKTQQLEVNLPPTGMATIKATFMGKDRVNGVAQYFSSPAAASTSGVLAAVNGSMVVNGAVVGLITGMQFTIAGGHSAEPTVGSNVYADIVEGRVKVTGQMTVQYQDAVFRDFFDQETEFSINMVFSTNNLAAADFISFSMPRCKATSAPKNDGERSIIQTLAFRALLPTNGGTGTDHEQSTLAVHDSLAV